MKTYHEYEPQDIDITSDDKDPVVQFLFTRVLIIGLTGFKAKPGEPDDPTWPIKRVVADLLNAAQRDGITIAKREPVPDVFRS